MYRHNIHLLQHNTQRQYTTLLSLQSSFTVHFQSCSDDYMTTFSQALSLLQLQIIIRKKNIVTVIITNNDCQIYYALCNRQCQRQLVRVSLACSKPACYKLLVSQVCIMVYIYLATGYNISYCMGSDQVPISVVQHERGPCNN